VQQLLLLLLLLLRLYSLCMLLCCCCCQALLAQLLQLHCALPALNAELLVAQAHRQQLGDLQQRKQKRTSQSRERKIIGTFWLTPHGPGSQTAAWAPATPAAKTQTNGSEAQDAELSVALAYRQ
jgi:hypothetical protein